MPIIDTEKPAIKNMFSTPLNNSAPTMPPTTKKNAKKLK